MKYYLKVITEYSEFHGRATRKEYWYFMLFHMIFLTMAMGLDNLFGLNFRFESNGTVEVYHYGWIYSFYAVAIIVPNLSILVRRLHDVGISGWKALFVFFPLIGIIWLLIKLCTRSNPYDNEWGPDPYPVYEEVEEEAVVEETEEAVVDEVVEAGEEPMKDDSANIE